MSPTPDSAVDDPQNIIADLQRELAERTAERDEASRRLYERTAERDEALEQQTATAEVLQVINSSPGDLAPVFDAMLEKALRLCEGAFGTLWTYEDELFHQAATRNRKVSVDRPFKPGPKSAGGRLVRGERFVHIADARDDDAYRSGDPSRVRIVDVEGARSYLAVPMRKGEVLLGIIAIYRKEVQPFTDKQIALLQNFAAQAVIAMENARLITETREALEQQTATAEVLGVINSSPGDLAPVFDAILEKARTLCSAAHGSLSLFDGERFRAVAINTPSDKFAERLREGAAASDSPFLSTLLDGARLVHIRDLAEIDYPGARTAVELTGAHTVLWVPLRKDGVLLGLICTVRMEIRPFSDKEIALVENFAAQAVIAMENARLIAETREALEQQTATAEVLGVINASPGDLAPVFEAMLEKALRLCGADLGGITAFDGARHSLVAATGIPANYGSSSDRPVPGSADYRLRAGEDVVHLADITADEVYRSGDARRRWFAEMTGARSALWVALRKDAALLGMFVIFRKEVCSFTDKQIALLQNFAAQAVIAMENARLITETREALEQQTATAEVLQVINSSPGDLAPVFDAMLEKAMRLCGFDHGSLQTFDGQQFRAVAVRGLPEPIAVRLRQGFRPGPQNPMARLLEGDRLVHIPDLAQIDTTEARFAVEHGSRSLLCIPLRKDAALLGQIVAVRQEVRPFGEKDIALLQNFAAQAVIAMENARLITETREALEQQTATAEVLQVINSSPGDLAPVFDAILEKALALCDAAQGGLITYDGEYFRALAVRGIAPLGGLLNTPYPAGALQQRLLNGKRLVHIADIASIDSSSQRFQAAVRAGFHTLLFIPLRKDNALLGYITALRVEVKPFSDKEIALLENFAAQAVIAMENARLIIETREALEQQTATAEVLGVINSSPGDLAPVFDAILEKAHAVCDAATGSLQIYDGESIRAVTTRGLPDRFANLLRERRQSGRISGMRAAFLQGVPYFQISDTSDAVLTGGDPGFATGREIAGVRTLLHVPLRKDGELLGVIASGRLEVRPFSDKEIALLQNFAAQAVIAMENARLLGELRQRTEEVGELNRGLETRVAEQVDELGRVGRLKRFLAPQLAELIVSQGDEKILESHRREIVVVFCDLRGYTAFTETAEPEEVLDFLRQYHGALGPLVSQYEGTLDQFSGDGIMVFFNDPVPCPDPAERAVKMAVAMREAAGTLIAAWRRRGRMLGFGAGIAQGYATLGQIGFADRAGYTAIGTVCNLAARLCAEAKDGQILVAQRVAVAVEERVPVEEVGELTLKGLTQPVVAYNVPLTAIQPAFRVIEGGPQSV